MLRHTVTGLIIDCTEAKREHCQLSFLMFYAIIHPIICIVNTKIRAGACTGPLNGFFTF